MRSFRRCTRNESVEAVRRFGVSSLVMTSPLKKSLRAAGRGRPPEFPRAIRLRRSHRFTGLTTRSCTSTPETAGFATAPKSLCVQLMECRARPVDRIFGPGNAYPHGIEAHQIPNGVLTIVLGNAAVGESLSRANRVSDFSLSVSRPQ